MSTGTCCWWTTNLPGSRPRKCRPRRAPASRSEELWSAVTVTIEQRTIAPSAAIDAERRTVMGASRWWPTPYRPARGRVNANEGQCVFSWDQRAISGTSGGRLRRIGGCRMRARYDARREIWMSGVSRVAVAGPLVVRAHVLPGVLHEGQGVVALPGTANS